MLVYMAVLELLCKSNLVVESLCHRGTTDFELRWRRIDSLGWNRVLEIHLAEI